jgi:hypothetical protein
MRSLAADGARIESLHNGSRPQITRAPPNRQLPGAGWLGAGVSIAYCNIGGFAAQPV